MADIFCQLHKDLLRDFLLQVTPAGSDPGGKITKIIR
jgi:hypothetical protein